MKKSVRKIIGVALLLVTLTLATAVRDCAAGDPWEYLVQWQGRFVNVNLRTNIVLLRKVRLIQVTDNGLVVQDGSTQKFVSYDRILTVDLVN